MQTKKLIFLFSIVCAMININNEIHCAERQRDQRTGRFYKRKIYKEVAKARAQEKRAAEQARLQQKPTPAKNQNINHKNKNK